jgi:hypothetical protein
VARINWMKGLLRLWFKLTLLWIALMFFFQRPDERLWTYLAMGREIERVEAVLENTQSDPVTLPDGNLSSRAEAVADLAELRRRQLAGWDRIVGYVGATVAPSIFLLALGLAIGWIRGSSGDSTN